MEDIIVMPKGWDIYVIGRDYQNHFWLEARHIESNKLFRDFGESTPHAKTLREVAYAAAAAIEKLEGYGLNNVLEEITNDQ
jgi:hypothetical protein